MLSRLVTVTLFIAAIILISSFALKNLNKQSANQNTETTTTDAVVTPSMDNPLAIEAIKAKDFKGSDIKIEEELPESSNYKRYRASYLSDGLKIYGLLTVPAGEVPKEGFPTIVFAHGYIPPEEYATTERYVAYVDNLASAGYVVFKIDYRGHGDSEGRPEGAYFSPAYTYDTLNAISSLQKLSYVNPDKIGAWGHSMAGMILTRALAAKPDVIKATVIWGGVVGSYEDIMREWWSKRRNPTFTPSQREMNSNRPSRQAFIAKYGEPSEKNEFWRSVSPKTYIADIKAPIQLNHGEADETVPVELSQLFAKALQDNDKVVELYTYPGADHNISSPSFETAMQRTIEFFDKYLK